MFWDMFWLIAGLAAIPAGLATRHAGKRALRHADSDNRQLRERAENAAIIPALGLILACAGLTAIAWDSFTIVPARNVGVVNVFGKASQALDNGAHLTLPWASIEQVDATVQNINLNTDLKAWAETQTCTAVAVRLGNQTTACVDVTGQWNIDQQANANELWQRYRGPNDDVVGNVGRNVVSRELQRAMNAAFATYDPLAILKTGGTISTASTATLSATVLADLRASVDPGVTVDKLLISLVHYDTTTQGKLNGYAQALADTQIATQQRLTAEQQRLANEALAAAASSSPGVMFQNCLSLLDRLSTRGQLQYLENAGLMCRSGDAPALILGQRP